MRAILDEGGLGGTAILVSGNLDEDRIAALVSSGAPVDGFGVGEALSTVSDAPALGAIYKLVEIERDRDGAAVGVMKRSPGKHTYPGRKQVWRRVRAGRAVDDTLDLQGEEADGVPLLRCVMRGGRRATTSAPVMASRAYALAAVAALPGAVRRLRRPARYPVRVGPALEAMTARLAAPDR